MQKIQIAICATAALGFCLMVPKGVSAFPAADTAGKAYTQTVEGKSAATPVRWAGRVGGFRGVGLGRGWGYRGVGFGRGIGWRGYGWRGVGLGGGWGWGGAGWGGGYYGGLGYGWGYPVGFGLGYGATGGGY